MSIAESALTGRLDGNPFVQGLLVQLMARMDKESRGVCVSRGRSKAVTETASRLMQDAALTLAISGGHQSLAAELGQKKTPLKLHLDQLHALSLPNPALSFLNPERLQQNLTLVDQRFPRDVKQSARRLIVGLDHTYLTKQLMQSSIDGRAGLVGGAWSPEEPHRAFLPFDELPPSALKTEKAGLMLELLAWNPTSETNETFSVAAMPMTLKRSKRDDQTLVKQGNIDTVMQFKHILYMFELLRPLIPLQN